MKNPLYANFYASVETEITGKKPGEMLTKKGETMIYGVTILKDAPNAKAALKFIEFLLDKEKGVEIMKNNGQPSVIPAYSESYNNIPKSLKKYASEINNQE